MPVPPFVARQLPANGLVWIWQDVPKAMRAGTWAMAEYTITRQLHNGYASCVYKVRKGGSGRGSIRRAASGRLLGGVFGGSVWSVPCAFYVSADSGAVGWLPTYSTLN